MKSPHPITVYRADHGLTRAEFARLLNVDTSTLCRWEAGVTCPGQANLRRLDDLGIPAAECIRYEASEPVCES